MVQWNDTVEEIPYYNATDDFWPDDYSNASQSMDEDLLNGDESFTHAQDADENFFESALDELALEEMALEVGKYDKTFLDSLEEKALEVGKYDKTFLDNDDNDMEDLPELDSSDVDSMSADGKKPGGYMAAGAVGLLSGAVAFFMRKITNMRNSSADNDDITVGLDDFVDGDDLQNAATSFGNNAYRASAESSRNGFGAANFPSGVTPPVGVESAA
jgi:hypothetical protein